MSAAGIIGLVLWALWMAYAIRSVRRSNWDNDPRWRR